MKKVFLIALVVVLVISCKNEVQKNTSINGVWKSIGSGWILQIQDSTKYSFYDITSISCLPARQAELEEIKESLSLITDTLSLSKGVMTYQFTRIKKLPELCNTEFSIEQKNNALLNFEVFSETVKEHYAFLELNNLNWSLIYERQKNKLNSNSPDTDLYKVLVETLELLNDNHAFLEATDAVYEALEQLPEEEDEDDSEDDLPEYGDFGIANMVTDHHLIEDLTDDSWLIKWGKMEDNIGFIQIKAMWLYADLDVPESLVEDIGFVDAYVETFHKMNEGMYIDMEVDGVRKTMDKVMADLIDTKSIIIDVRFNGGGQDAVNFEILKRFNPQRQKIVTAKLKHGNDYSSLQHIYLEGSTNAYTNPVFVLTSPQSGSAAEAFAIGTIPIKHIKRIGSSTQGALSTALEKTLPNDWVFSISNEIYMDINGNSYENIGVPVDYELGYPHDRQSFFRSVANDLDSDKQSILMAIEQLKKR